MLTLYETTVPVFINNLKNLNKILEKGVAFAKEDGAKVTEAELLESRLIEDMGGLIFQIQRASDSAKGLAQRIGGVEPVVLQDNEKTFDDLFVRIQRTIDVLEKVKPEYINTQEDTEVTIQGRNTVYKYSGKDYALTMAIPNFYFHYTTAYNLLRKAGVQIGKGDFLSRS